MALMGSRMPDYPRGGGNGAKRLRKHAVDEPFVALALDELSKELVETIALVLNAGGALHLGMTSDGNAILVRAWIGGDKYEDYVTGRLELQETLEALQGETEGVTRDRPAGPRKAPKNGS